MIWEDDVEFVALSDGSGGTALSELVTRAGDTILQHPSGRPWLAGRWSADEICHAEAGNRRIVVLGRTTATPESLRALIDRADDTERFGRFVRELPGAHHVLTSLGSRVRMYATVSGTTQLFHAEIDGVTIAADSSYRLAELLAAQIDDAAVAQFLLSPAPPWPLSRDCPWRGVDRVDPDRYLELAADGHATTGRWWTVPDPDTPASSGAHRIRDALSESVRARVVTGRTVTADLSGGMDSTSLCFLAERVGARLLTTRFTAADPSNDDSVWASRAARALPVARHTVLPRAVLPANFAELGTGEGDLEAPLAWIRTRALLEFQARELARQGSAVHLTGHGGDELFFAAPVYDHTLVRTHPLRFLADFGTKRASRRWRLTSAARQLLDRRSYGEWLADVAASLDDPSAGPGAVSTGWESHVRLGPWVTPQAVEQVRDRLRSAPDGPLSPLRGQHLVLVAARLCGDSVRRANRVTAQLGVPYEAPYLDNAVIDSALSIRFPDRAPADAYKPVLARAMHGVVPGELLQRPTKGEFSEDVYSGFARHRAELVELCSGMRLAELGLVDPTTFRAALLAPHPRPKTVNLLLSTIATEVWLRCLPVSTAAAASTAVGGIR